MKKIYLASNSKARRQLLKLFGLKFTVMPAGIPEKMEQRGSFAALAMGNALAKARSVSRAVKGGIIIGADTIVVQDGKIFGKPKNIADARRMLKRLSGASQRLYTGIAIIDNDTHRQSLDYEKTSVYMDPLSDEEITRYFSRVSPLDKAGSFDIQGRGALFIRRIEGCYYNVVGLPARKLRLMLKEFGVRMLCICVTAALCAAAGGCSTEYNIVTGRQETYYYSTEKEVQMGQAICRQVEKEYTLDDDPLIAHRVGEIGRGIAAVSDRRDIEYVFKVLKEEEVNAVSLPGGFVYVNKGLIDKVSNDDELAGVLAHEVGHITARHAVKRLQALQGYMVAGLLLAAGARSGEVSAAADAAFTELLLGYSREDELLADQLGARYAGSAGYDPRGMISFLQKLQDIERRKPLRPRSYFRTHPYPADRIRVTKQEIGEPAGFTDYINTQDRPHR